MMIPIITLITQTGFVNLPQDLTGWISLILLLGILTFLNYRWKTLNRLAGKTKRYRFLILLILAPLAGVFFGIAFPVQGYLSPPETPIDPALQVVMFFAALPLFIAAGTLGPLPATITALLSYLPLAYWSTHSIFTALEMALVSLLLSGALRQNYRTRLFHVLRIPLISGLLVAAVYPAIHLIITTIAVDGALVSRIDYAQSSLAGASIARGIEIILAGVIAQAMYLLSPAAWKLDRPEIPTPAERSLRTRFLASMAPLALALILTLIVSDWIVAGEAAERMLQARMENAAGISAKNVPYFLEAGQNIITSYASEQSLLSSDLKNLQISLENLIQIVPFFNQLLVLDPTGETIASYQTQSYPGQSITEKEIDGISYAIKGVPLSFTIPPGAGQTTAQISFMTVIKDQLGAAQRILVGRTDLKTNPLSQSILAGLDNLAKDDIQGILLDEDHLVLFHPDPSMVMLPYLGLIQVEPNFYEDFTKQGTRMFVYNQPAEGRSWSVIQTVPALSAQQLALDIAVPMVAVIIGLFAVAALISSISLNNVTSSLQTLTSEAGRLAQGELDRPLAVEGTDEVGQLRRTFERMRVSLKERLDELNQLLLVSQGVASSLEITEAIQPVLEAALARGATFTRVILMPGVVQELGTDPVSLTRFGLGPNQEKYLELDDQILALVRQQDRLVLSNIFRPRLINLSPDSPKISSIIAIALRHENMFFGALWAGYEEPHRFTAEEVRYLVTLGSQAALATANVRLFLNAEIGRQRLAAILASSPDPILVTDQSNRLLLANPAAWQVLNLRMEANEGPIIDQVIRFRELAEMLRASSAEKQVKEIYLQDGRVYSAAATTVIAEGQRVGRVCLLRDVTHFKELDALKTDFVSTVSHDLRSPLTLMRGYASMLEMVGQLNEQQNNYIQKIVLGVEDMSRLVNNLLDLGRIEAGINLKVEKASCQEIIEKAISGLQLQAAQKQIQITSEIPGEEPTYLEADRALLQQALTNLVENAIKYSRTEGRILIRVNKQPDKVNFEVIDNGIGISPVDLPRLFEKFYRGAQQSSKDQRGTGLGLAIVKSIAERHGGRVWADSKLGKGSIFILEIPLRQI